MAQGAQRGSLRSLLSLFLGNARSLAGMNSDIPGLDPTRQRRILSMSIRLIYVRLRPYFPAATIYLNQYGANPILVF
jgi:hypothetical protein